MDKKLSSFLKIGFEIAKAQIPAIAIVESAIKESGKGGLKKENVLDLVKASPMIVELIKGNDIQIDEILWNEGLNKINDGYVDIMNSIKKVSEVNT